MYIYWYNLFNYIHLKHWSTQSICALFCILYNFFSGTSRSIFSHYYVRLHHFHMWTCRQSLYPIMPPSPASRYGYETGHLLVACRTTTWMCVCSYSALMPVSHFWSVFLHRCGMRHVHDLMITGAFVRKKADVMDERSVVSLCWSVA